MPAAEPLRIWSQLETTDPAFTKQFNRGGFKGTAINPCYVAQKLTEVFGPCGEGWRLVVETEEYREGHTLRSGDKSVIHVVRCRLDYVGDGGWKQTGSQYGQTTFVGENKNGTFTDEEAPKKSITDALSKCAALLGMSADIYSGKWDGNKYVNDTANKKATPPKKKTPTKKPEAPPTASAAPAKGTPPGLPEGCDLWLAEQWVEYLQETPEPTFLYETFLKLSTSGVDASEHWETVCGAFADVLRDSGGIDSPDGKRLVTALQGERERLDSEQPATTPTKRKAAPKKKPPAKKKAAKKAVPKKKTVPKKKAA